MIIYKITNLINGKIYIGQTVGSISDRWYHHLKCAQKNWKSNLLYKDIQELGVDKFSIEEIDHANNQDDLNYLEAYYIVGYDSVRRGYNKAYGSLGGKNSMFNNDIKQHHDSVCRSENNRIKISNTMKEYRKAHPFTKKHREKLSEKAKGNINGIDNPSHSVPCYCIDKGIRRDFPNYKEAGLWWYNTYHPFGEKYSQATYQRKIIDCIEHGHCRVKRPGKLAIIITKDIIEWYREEVMPNEKVD